MLGRGSGQSPPGPGDAAELHGPADSRCTGQNAETRSNGAALGRPMMLFLTPALNMPGAAGFSAQGGPLLYDRRHTHRTASRRESGLDLVSHSNIKCDCDDPRQVISLYQCVSLRMRRSPSLKLQPVGFSWHLQERQLFHFSVSVCFI